MKISVITSCFNSGHYLAETMQSVLGQSAVSSGRVELEYIVKDGGSTDNTELLVRQFASASTSVRFVSMKDRGLYDGLAQAFAMASGDIVAYINAGDFYQPHAFDVVADCFSDSAVQWLTGARLLYNDRSHPTSFRLPIPYRRSFIKAAVYGPLLPFIQQESTFWRRDLLKQVDFEAFRKFRLAGDYYLWSRFAEVADLDVVETCLAGFRVHEGQLSSDRKTLFGEMHQIRTRRLNLLDWFTLGFDYFQYMLSPELRGRLRRPRTYAYDAKAGFWRRSL